MAFVAVMWMESAVEMTAGTPKFMGRHQLDGNFPTVHPVAGSPADWIPRICEKHALYTKFGDPLVPAGFLFTYPNTRFDLPRAETSAMCPARYRGASDQIVMIAQYSSEDLMQLDLAANKIQWYCFAVFGGRLFVMATRAEGRVKGPNGLNASPVLAPLVHDGFIVYSGLGI